MREKTIKEIREKNCFTIKEMAERLGISYFHYYNIESGRRGIKAIYLQKFCIACDCDIRDMKF